MDIFICCSDSDWTVASSEGMQNKNKLVWWDAIPFGYRTPQHSLFSIGKRKVQITKRDKRGRNWSFLWFRTLASFIFELYMEWIPLQIHNTLIGFKFSENKNQNVTNFFGTKLYTVPSIITKLQKLASPTTQIISQFPFVIVFSIIIIISIVFSC